jgi:hypothetical protein
MTSNVLRSSSISPNIPKILEDQDPRGFGGKIIWNSAQSEGMARTPHPTDNSEVAKRLRALRFYLAGDNQTAFGKRYGIEVKRWNNFEREMSLSKGIAFLLVQKIPGLTLDWLYLGNEDGLPVKLQRELAEAGRQVHQLPGPPKAPPKGTPSRGP